MDQALADEWTIDFSACTAMRGSDLLTFSIADGNAISVAFVSEHVHSFDEQCFIAGEAIAAILAMRLLR